MVRSLFWLDLALQHDRSGGASFRCFVDLAIHDSYTLEILLNDFLARDLDVLLGITAGPFADTVDHVFFHQDSDLFRQVGSRGKFRDPLADDRAFCHITLTLADHVLV